MSNPNKRVNKLRMLAVVVLLLLALLAGVRLAGTTAARAEITPTPDQQQALERINYYRKLAGVPPARLDPALLQSAAGHAAYVDKNGWQGDPHTEDAKKEGFVGTSMSDRAKKFGYSGSVNEDMAAVGDPVLAVDSLMNTVSHRTPILEPAYTDIGYGNAKASGKTKVDVIAFGSTKRNWNYEPPVIQWPPASFTNFGTTYWGESPSPFSGVSFPLGNPVTLTYRGTGKMELVAEECKLLDQDGNRVDFVSGVGTTFTMRGTYILAARQPLARNRTYEVTMVYKLDGQKQTRTWNFATGERLASSNLTAALLAAPGPIRDLWRQVDGPVAGGIPARTWLYGPDITRATSEEYAEGEGGKRNVWYLDKARLEITRPGADAKSEWYVTSGLLPKELITGRIQTGDARFKDGPGPARVPVAGDAYDNPRAPTYASFTKIASLNNDRRSPDRSGQIIKESLSAGGETGPISPPVEVKYGQYDKTLGHNIADVFVASFKGLPRDWLFIVGLPLAEPYWSKVKVGGTEKEVLVQVFERRVLTYTPSNPAEWRVEMGNVGLHYQLWRYAAVAPASKLGGFNHLKNN